MRHASDSIRYAQSVCILTTTHGDFAIRDSAGVSESARIIPAAKTLGDLDDAVLSGLRLGILGGHSTVRNFDPPSSNLPHGDITPSSRTSTSGGASSMPEKGRGVASEDFYWLVGDENCAKSRKRINVNFYVEDPACLSYDPPPESIRRMRRFMATTFPRSDEGHRAHLATQSLAAGAGILPEVILFFIAPDGDGTSSLEATPASALWDTGFGRFRCIMIHAEEEFWAKFRKYLEGRGAHLANSNQAAVRRRRLSRIP